MFPFFSTSSRSSPTHFRPPAREALSHIWVVDRASNVLWRLLGRLVDGALVYPVVWVANSLRPRHWVVESSYESIERHQVAGPLPWWLVMLPVVLEAAYVIVSIGCFGRTVGQRACGLRIISSVSGGRPTWRQSLLRWATLGIPGAIGWLTGSFWLGAAALGWTALVLVWSLGDVWRRGLHDKFAEVVVVRIVD